ncbi:MAG TPA: tyrosine-type recombinase/integrase [Roseiflexaceae bacterium]
MKRPAIPTLSDEGQQALEAYTTALREHTDISPATVRNYRSDLRQFIAWCERTWAAGQEHAPAFTPAALTTPLITRYRAYLQHTRHLKPASVNRALVSIKRYVAWALETGQIGRNVAAPVKLIPTEDSAPRHLDDTEEEALVAAVTATGSLRDQTIIILLLHTGLRARELCTLRRDSVTIGKRSGFLRVYGKRNKYREVPLNATARAALTAYLPELADTALYLFPSAKTGQALTERALGHLIKKYATRARVSDVSPHDLRHRFGYRMAETVPLHRLAQMMGHDSLDTTLLYIRGTRKDLQNEVEKIAWA